MSSKRSAEPANSGASSIDAIVETPIAKVAEALRPIAHLRPSWIGPKAPDRPVTPGGITMTIPVTIEFTSPGLQPPVFIATSLSDPQWEPLEMEGTQNDRKEFKFSKSFNAQEGEYQYKLRLGPGDWWTCDENQPQVDDGQGNKNNLVIVKAGGPQHDRADSVHEHGAPLMPHESHDAPVTSSSFLQSERKDAAAPHTEEHQAPFFRHESLVPESSDSEHEHHDEHPHSPLLPHESAAPTQEAVSPLFRHESSAIDDQKHEERGSTSPVARVRKHSGDSIPEEADPNEPGLEQFPTDHRGILDSIARTQKSLAEDQTSDVSEPSSPVQPAATKSSPTLPSLAEDEEEQEVVKAVPKVKVVGPDNRPAAPITPPITPTKEKPIDPIVERIQEKVESVRETAKSAAERESQKLGKTNYAAILTKSVFAFAVALTAVGLWYFAAENGRYLDVIET
ncbi:Putative immunoglobulin-like protein [Septoria linicola]|uniref:Immunoglobulin-like protein n=1 Tax=Septoria linicola TaxID=215465 RepID=A0A9Q9AXX0_9PEZI|nr:putative immunoglobulin-like protein [Septoria linicola]USW52646.1 Putative immunoglobulin-like protein [Septoria linicola]